MDQIRSPVAVRQRYLGNKRESTSPFQNKWIRENVWFYYQCMANLLQIPNTPGLQCLGCVGLVVGPYLQMLVVVTSPPWSLLQGEHNNSQ